MNWIDRPNRLIAQSMNQAKPKKISIDSFFERGRQSRLDRRSGEDRRKTYSLDYFLKGGKERRQAEDRRHQGERRNDWMRIDKWYSVLWQIYTLFLII